jgi:hypothetical protein
VLIHKATARKPAGYIRIDVPDGKPIEHDTLQCVHCEAHWVVQPGSGRRRGWCTKCNGPVCGQHNCWSCLPADVQVYGE